MDQSGRRPDDVATPRRWSIDPDELFGLMLGGLLSVLGSGFAFVMPVYSMATAATLHLSPVQIGLVDSLETVAAVPAAILISLAAGHIGPRLMIGAAAAVALGDLIVVLMWNFPSLVVLRFATALFGEGPCSAYAFVVLGRLRRPERGYGVGLTSVALVSSAAMHPALQFGWAGDGASLSLFGCLAIFGMMLLAFASQRSAAMRTDSICSMEPNCPPEGVGVSRLPWLARLLTAQTAWAISPGIIWPFAAQLARHAGAQPDAIDAAFVISPIIGLTGALIPVFANGWISDRLGIAVGSLGFASTALLVPLGHDPIVLAGLFSSLILFWSLAQTFQPAMVALIDRSGRSAALIPVAQLAGFALGTAFGGIVNERLGIDALPSLSAAIALLATPLFLVGRRQSQGTD